MQKSNLKTAISGLKNLDINRLYQIQSYLNYSNVFFTDLELRINMLKNSCYGLNIDDLIDFYNYVSKSYFEFKNKVGVK